MLHKLRNEQGLDAVAIDKAGGVGGTWYWNKYPGALSDSESFVYQYSFDRDLYAADTVDRRSSSRQPEILAYLNGVVDRYDLREHIHLETGMTEADVRRGLRHLDRAHRPRHHLPGPLPGHRAGPAVGDQHARPATASNTSRVGSCTPGPGPRSWT